jgi:hypothetical protein
MLCARLRDALDVQGISGMVDDPGKECLSACFQVVKKYCGAANKAVDEPRYRA